MQLSLDLSEKAKEAGIKKAVDHSGKEWQEKADFIFKVYLNTLTSERFTCENFREYYYSISMDKPPTDRAFSGIITRARSKGLIRAVGIVQTKSVSAHRANATLWEKTF